MFVLKRYLWFMVLTNWGCYWNFQEIPSQFLRQETLNFFKAQPLISSATLAYTYKVLTLRKCRRINPKRVPIPRGSLAAKLRLENSEMAPDVEGYTVLLTSVHALRCDSFKNTPAHISSISLQLEKPFHLLSQLRA